MSTRGRPTAVLAVLLVLVLLGAGVAAGLSAALGIRTEAKRVPTERLRVAPVAPTVAPPRLGTIEAAGDERTRVALGELRSAIAAAPRTAGTLALTVRHRAGSEDDDSYRLSGNARRLTVVAPSLAGAVRAVYDLARQVRGGRAVTTDVGHIARSRLPFRMVDLGAVGVDDDPGRWRKGTDYSLSTDPYGQVALTHAPYVDRAALAAWRDQVDRYAAHVLAEGYDAIAVPGFLEYLTFQGLDVYRPGDAHLARARALRAAFAPIFQHLHDLGLKVYLSTDMLALTTPLKHYLEHRFGGLKTDSAKFWGVYARGLDELYRTMPAVSGVIVRVGEAGKVYDRPGWDYYSTLDVTTVATVRAMLRAFTGEADRSARDVVFRTWSVGVGAVGDMHTNPRSYHAALDGLDSPHLVVSTKYTLGDFYSHLPLNDTLETGSQRRIVELQSRREFEDAGALPNDLGALYAQALSHFIASNPRVEGIWTWTQMGGPLWAGPRTLELRTGFWQLFDLNTLLAGRIAQDPHADPAMITQDWIRQWLSEDGSTVAAIEQAMALSREAITKGLYLGGYADRRVFALGLEPPPMMWIFEWDILTGDSAALDLLYAITRDRGGVDAAIHEGDDAVSTAARMRELVAATPASTWRSPVMRDQMLGSLDFEVDLFGVLAAYRATFLRHVQWLDTGSSTARRQWKSAERRFRALARDHEHRYGHDLAHPAYNLTAARIGLDRADRDPAMALIARVLLVLVVGWLLLGALARRPRRPGVRAARATWLAGTRPWRAHDAVAGLGPLDRALLVGVPLVALVLSRGVSTWFAAPAQWLISGVGWAALVVGLALALRRRDPWPVVAAVGGAVLFRVLLLAVALAFHGPGGYWFAFWTEPGHRSAYVVAATVAFGWVLVAAVWSLRSVTTVVAVVGAGLLAGGVLVGAVGLESALSTWNDQMALLPWGMHRILGITVYLGIPTALPWWAAGAGCVLLAGAALPKCVHLARRVSRPAR